ncbi:MAG: hypothetical protein ABSF03_33110 [Streptosporangiaceae bacterium]
MASRLIPSRKGGRGWETRAAEPPEGAGAGKTRGGRAPGEEFDRIVDPSAMTGDTGHLVM